MRIVNCNTLLILFVTNVIVQAFVVRRDPFIISRRTRLFAELPEIDTMKASEMRKELESYGISTKSLFEKGEFIEALKKARAEGMSSTTNSDEKTSTNGETVTEEESSSETSASREERYQEALEIAKTMKVGDLKKELTSRGISTASFFEKTEFIKAYAEAIADNIQGGSAKPPEEPRDPAYRDVVMQKINTGVLRGQKVIDVMIRDNR